ncbi:glycosyltransferase [Psychromonas sp. SP041]|uniref:glycosyltransferase n=1 Tax=Psychromonas sp. SP041 TaxID=1365007 RepID=UPI000400A3CA|nr:glycosyltransferase [Psychromonas sp. SP041]
MFSKVKKFIRLVLKKEQKKAKIYYSIEFKKQNKIKNIALFESYHGSQIASNEFYLLKDLYSRKDKDLSIYVACKKTTKAKIQERLNYYGLNDVNLIEIHSKKYCAVLCIAKYLINSTSFPDYFLKKEGQIYLNTWHGTPFKNMGRSDIDEPHMITNIQRNFLMCDYILFPNEHTKKVMDRDYMLTNLYKGQYVLEGYPRNDVFFSDNDALRNELGLSDKKIIVYMPTWRGKLGRKNNMFTMSHVYLFIEELSKSLSENEVLYVSFHYLMKKNISLDDFCNTYELPAHIETYDFLNLSDVLITDYSSVMFDFSNSNKKIALYQFDYEEYKEYRGITINEEDIPFYKSNDISEIINYVKDEGTCLYDRNSLSFSSLESENSAKNLNDLLFFNKKDSVRLDSPLNNGKENILIYPGNLAKNGITTSITSLLGKVDKSKFNIFLTFSQSAVKANKNTILELDESIGYLPFRAMLNYTYYEALVLFLYFNMNVSFLSPIVSKIYNGNFKKAYPNCDFVHLLQFSGYDRHVINLFASSDIKKTIYVHNDMWKEYKIRGFCHKPTMDVAYSSFDNIALVNGVLSECFGEFKVDKSKLRVVENLHPHDTVVVRAHENIVFNPETKSTIELDKLNLILNDNTKKKFISIGRFSPEKGHDRLISAFERACIKNNDLYLIIIGGPGKIYKETLKLAQESKVAEKIIIINSIRNPFPILKHCDLFLLSSHYEGLGLVMLEAISLGVPVISTDIPAPKAFLEQGYGTIVDNNENGLYQGMLNFIDGGISPVNINWEKYNKNALEQFEGLLK